jgi:ParB-like chromosome segregation protein Spo0J
MDKNKQQYEIHPAATLFPMMDESSFERLKADIKENGQEKCITFFNGQLLDGRNRMKACDELGIEPMIEEIEDSGDGKFDPFRWVLSINLHRRHLTESQRAMVAARLATMKEGRPSKETGSIDLVSIEQAATMLSVGSASVKRAKQVIDAGSKEIVDAVEQGNLAVSFAANVVSEEPDKKTQTRVYKKGGKKALKEHISDPSPYVDQEDEKKESAVSTFKKLWSKWDQTQRTAVRVWIDEHYLDAK